MLTFDRTRQATGSKGKPGIFSPGRYAAGILLLVCGSAFSSPPEIHPGNSRSGHDFNLVEGYRGQIRRISVWFEPGRVLQWELTRSDDPEMNNAPFVGLDYGRTPTFMDQSFPRGVPEQPEDGQVLTITLEFGSEGEPDPIVRNTVTRWFQKKRRQFQELSEQEAEAEVRFRKEDLKEKR